MTEVSWNDPSNTPQVRVSLLNFGSLKNYTLGAIASGVISTNVFMMVHSHLTEDTLIKLGILNVACLAVLGLCEVAKDIFGKKK
jgi:hypothetical protein